MEESENPFVFYIDKDNYILISTIGNTRYNPYKQLKKIASNINYPFYIRRRALLYMIDTQHKDALNDCLVISEKIIESEKYTYGEKFLLCYNTFGIGLTRELLLYAYACSLSKCDNEETKEFHIYISKILYKIGIDMGDNIENKKILYEKEYKKERIRLEIFKIFNKQLNNLDENKQEIIIKQLTNPNSYDFKEMTEFIKSIDIENIIIEKFYCKPNNMIVLNNEIKLIVKEAIFEYTSGRIKDEA